MADDEQPDKPILFIGSSSEGIPVALALQQRLQRHADVRVWNQGVFGAGDLTLDRLLSLSRSVDFAALCLTPDDLTEKRGRTRDSPRDNIIFEAGLFMGRLGRRRTFLVFCDKPELDLPSDLLGLTAAIYPANAVEVAATKIEEALSQFAPHVLYTSSGRDIKADFRAEWRGGARGKLARHQDADAPVLSAERTTADDSVVLWITGYRERTGALRSMIRPELPEVGWLELEVEVGVRASSDCTFLIQLKANRASAGHYLGEKRFRLRTRGWRRLSAAFEVTTSDEYRVRFNQRTVNDAPSSLEIRRVSVVERIVRE